MKPLVFVFGSNLSGHHGAGAALFAIDHRGAEWGHGEGRQGNSYAIPTVDASIAPLPLDRIAAHVATFIEHATNNPDEKFEVTRIGCGIAGFTDDQIAPMFQAAPENCVLPKGWRL